ncbi:MAG: chromosome segregation protein SMC [Clostridium sp.]|nr:chromosome segregation protein SMC [Clostridium sp.]
MYLKSIEIQGFKSFANRILFEFHNGVTGIVGPNGSGKSNVADAVRWVLGEQSAKQLRGGSMQDVIFAGTELRKPQGFAHVAITLDNSDHVLPIEFDEVTVSRRLYRSGESEYKINGSPCRLRDINELFYDTGIGKEGYSIIGQGQIDRILSGRPEERRELFDEAAGIVKFKRRKAEAVKRLDNEQANLVRITDILSELERRVGPLRSQSEKAKEYLALRDSLRQYDINVFLLETKALREQFTDITEREGILKNDLDEAKRASEEKKKEHETLSTEVEELDALISENDENIRKTEVSIQSGEGRIALCEQQIRNEEAGEEQVAARLQAIAQEIARREEDAAGAGEQISRYEEEMAQKQEELARLTEEAGEYARSEEEKSRLSEELQAEIIRTLGKKAEIAAEEQRFRTQYEENDQNRARLAARLLEYRESDRADRSELDEKIRESGQAEEELSRIRSKEEELKDLCAKDDADIRDLNRQLSSAQQDYHIFTTKLESLRNLAERYEGYGGSIRRVMEEKSRVPGIIGVVADLIQTDKKYETAIETALGGSIQNIVTDTEYTAKRMIEFLKKNRFGRATFLPLSSVRGQKDAVRKEVFGEPGVIGAANTLVKTDPRYRGLMEYLLGRTVVAENIDSAIALAQKYRHSLRIVTLDGELLSAGGSMTGGAFKNSSNLLGRRREMEELEEKKDKALEAVENIQFRLVETEEKQLRHQEEMTEVRDQLQKQMVAVNSIRMETEQIKLRQMELKKTFEDLEKEKEDLEKLLEELEKGRREAGEKAEELLEQNEEMSGRLSLLADELADIKRQREEKDRELADGKLAEAAMRQKGEYLKETLERLRTEIAALEQEKEELTGQGAGRRDRIGEHRKEIESLKEELEKLRKDLEGFREVSEERRNRKAVLSGQQKAFFAEKEALDNRIRDLDKDLIRLQSQEERLSEKIEHQSEYIRTEYDLTYGDAEKFRDPGLGSVTAMKRALSGLKEQIRALGNVNVNAIEEYKEVSERCEFMEKQHSDMKAAEAALLRIIEELDSGMRKQFEEKFSEISREFDAVFKEMFGGGHAALQLEEGVDILEAGIGIISQPPGKKLQNMMQLSGGEKALTAIALLFAILNLKPSPFCLLDEIEAALDDANVDRFAGYLHKLTKHTQFIVITHRRGTMVGSDRLYGITMQEKGISTMVSVNLIEAELNREEQQEKSKRQGR